jgi:beta-glucosidase/6-phospho-beta-glucosidase/beta-galactosidase
MKELGITHYRFSISWSRIMSYSDKKIIINKKGIDYYNKLINSLEAAGI